MREILEPTVWSGIPEKKVYEKATWRFVPPFLASSPVLELVFGVSLSDQSLVEISRRLPCVRPRTIVRPLTIHFCRRYLVKSSVKTSSSSCQRFGVSKVIDGPVGENDLLTLCSCVVRSLVTSCYPFSNSLRKRNTYYLPSSSSWVMLTLTN